VSFAVLDAHGHAVPGTGLDDEAAKTLSRDPLVARARVHPADEVLVDYPSDRWGPGGDALATFAVPLRTEGTARGVLWFALSLDRARSAFVKTLGAVLLGVAFFSIAAWVLLYKALKIRILAPIVELTRGFERLRGGDLSARVTSRRKDEIGSLIESFNETVALFRDKLALEQKVDEAERLELAHRRLAQAHKELADAHAQLKATQERLVLTEKQASLGRLVKSFAHEVKNPLNAAQNTLPSLEDCLARLRERFVKTLGADADALVKEDLDDVATAVAILRRSVSRATAIIQDLQGFAQLGETDLVSVELKRVIDDAALSIRSHVEPEGPVELVIDIDAEPVVLKAFPTLLVQTLVNLLTNSVQALAGPGTVRVIARRKQDRVRIDVVDSGPGIPPENLKKIFEPFFTTKGVVGTGLGLALAYAYVEKHGGTMEVRSEVGKGATFTIDIPLDAQPPAGLGPRASALFDVPGDSVAAAARSRRGA
jgi:signal transduction histidine kinase